MTKTNGTHERWLQCLLDKGMFSDEMAITYPPEGVARRSVFVPLTEVAGKAGELGRVRVQVLTKSGDVFAVLPTNYHDVVLVAKHDLFESP